MGKLNKHADYLKKADLILALVIDKNLARIKSRGSVYEGLIRSIISQQICVAAANSVREKFLKCFGNDVKFPPPNVLANADEEMFKDSGLSRQKVAYVRNVAEHFLYEKLDENKFHKMSDQEVIDDLTRIKGVGSWTVEMLLIFNLNRPDIFSVKDGGLLNAIYKLYKINPKKYKKKNLEKKILKISQAWSPYRSLACRYLWNYKDKK